MTRPELHEDFADLLDSFVDHGVRFLLVGAHALATHGVERATGDLDIWVAPDPQNAQRVHDALAAFGAPLAAHGVRVSDFANPGNVYQLGLPPRRIDVLTSITAVPFDEAWRDRQTVLVAGHEISVAGRQTLLRNKRATGRPKDLLDVRALELLSGEQRDP